MKIIVNGETLTIEQELSLSDLLANLDIPSLKVAIERNREIVPKSLYDHTMIGEGDQLEIVNFVGGG